MNKIILLMGLFFLSSTTQAKNTKIIGGDIPSLDSPGFYNTVALIKKENNKIFCTGSIATKRLIVTAKHCLAGKKIEDFDIFFGASTLDLDNGVIVAPKRFQVRYPTDWEMSFPSGDIAWVELSEDIPSFAKPLRILSDSSLLPVGGTFMLAGYGNKKATGAIEAGEKFFSLTRLNRYLDNARFSDVMVFKGDIGQGACHGDSGGPAYVRLENEKGQQEWFLVGVTNGFDLILTPNSMSRTSDPDFPFNVDCSQNENLYTFIGGHGKWIEDTSGISLDTPSPFQERNWELGNSAKTLREWCESKDLGSPEWNTLKMLLDQEVDTLQSGEAQSFYLSCDNIVNFLQDLEEIHFDGDKMLNANYGLRNLGLLPRLKKLSFTKVVGPKILLADLRDLKLDILSFSETPIIDLSFLNTTLEIKRIVVNRSALTSLKGIEQLDSLDSIDLGSNNLSQISELAKFTELRELYLGGSKLEDYSILAQLKSLEILDLKSSLFDRPQLLVALTSLRELTLSNQSFDDLDFSSLPKLERLSLSRISFKTIHFGKLESLRVLDFTNSSLSNISELANMKALEELTLSFNQITDLDPIRDLVLLQKINISANPIRDLEPLRRLSNLEVLRVFQTPLAKGEVVRTSQNCPIDGAEILRKFCSR